MPKHSEYNFTWKRK